MNNKYMQDEEEQNPLLVDGVDVQLADEYPEVPYQKGQVDQQIDDEMAQIAAMEAPEAVMSNPQVQQVPQVSQPNKQDQFKQIVEKYKKFKYNPEEFKQLQDTKKDNDTNLNYLAAANKISQGLVQGGGAKIDDGSELVNQLKKSNDIPVDQYLQGMKGQKEGYDLDYESEMNDPQSDISKFSREQAKSKLKTLGMNEETVAQLDNMTAKQLEKLGLSAPSRFAPKTPQQSDYETQDGQPLSFDPVTNSYLNILNGEKYTGPVRRKIMQQFIDPNTGQMKLRDRTNIMDIGPASTVPQKVKEETPIFRKDLNPKDKDLLDKTRDELNKDPRYKNSQEAVDGADNALVLLKGNIQGGDLVRAIQTMLSKSAGNTGVLTEPDVQGFGGRQDVMSRLGAMATLATQNKLTEGDRKFLTEYATAMQKAAKRNLLEATKVYETQLANDLGIKPNQSQGLLNIEQRANPVLETQPMVRVIEVKTGKTGSMPKDQADKAIKSGKYQLEGQK